MTMRTTQSGASGSAGSDSSTRSEPDNDCAKPEEARSGPKDNASDVNTAEPSAGSDSISSEDGVAEDGALQSTLQLAAVFPPSSAAGKALIVVKAVAPAQHMFKTLCSNELALRPRMFVPMLCFTVPSYQVWKRNLNVDASLLALLQLDVSRLELTTCLLLALWTTRPTLPGDFINHLYKTA